MLFRLLTRALTALERERTLEYDIGEYTKALGQAQRAIEDKNKQIEKQMAMTKDLEATVQSMKQELFDYKMRAKKVLQQREATIQELTEKLTSPGMFFFLSFLYLSIYSIVALTPCHVPGAGSSEDGDLQGKWKELVQQKQQYDQLQNEFEEVKIELEKVRHTLIQTQEQAGMITKGTLMPC